MRGHKYGVRDLFVFKASRVIPTSARKGKARRMGGIRINGLLGALNCKDSIDYDEYSKLN
jgi:hypothetical protein